MALNSSTQPRQARSLAHNVLWNWGTLVFTTAVLFVLSPFVVRSLGASKYGVWVLLVSLVGYLGLLDLGVRGAVTRYIARLHAERADVAASKLASTALTIFSSMGLVAILLAALGSVLIVDRFHFDADDTQTARIVILIGGLTVATTLVGAAFGGVIVGLQRFDRAGQIEIGVGIVRTLSVFLALAGGLQLVALAVIQLVASLLRTLANAWAAHRLYPDLHFHLGTFDRRAFREIVSFGSSSTLLMFTSSIVFYSDSVVIGAFLPVAAVTLFSIAGNLTDNARNVLRGLSTTLTPHTSALELQGKRAIMRVILASGRTATLLIAPITVTFILRGSQFIGLWMGQEYAEPSGRILTILSYSLTFLGAGQIMYSALLGLSRHQGLVGYNLLEAAVNLALSIVLVQRVGLVGVAWATAVPSLAMSFFVLPWYVRRKIGIPWRAYYWNAWLRPIAAMVPFAAGTALVARYWPGSSLVGFFAGVLAALPLAAVGAWIFALDSAERTAFVAAAQRRLRAADRPNRE